MPILSRASVLPEIQHQMALNVRFATSSPTGGAPTYFYGIKNGRVTKFHSSDGSSVDYLTDPQPGGGADDPQLVGNDVYFLQGAGTCANALMKVSTAGIVHETTILSGPAELVRHGLWPLAIAVSFTTAFALAPPMKSRVSAVS